MTRLPKDEAMLDDLGDEIIERRFLEDAIAYWDEALGAEMPRPVQTRLDETVVVDLEETLTAPRTESTDVQPVELYHYDGLVPRSREELVQELTAIVLSVTRTPMEVRLPELPSEPIAAARVFVFREPVHEALGVTGELLTSSSTGEDITWRPGLPARILIELIDARPKSEPFYQELRCRIEGGHLARWEEA